MYIAQRRASGSTKGVIIGLCAALILLISISRVYLGVHYPTDIIAGIIGGAFCIVLSTLVLKGLHEPLNKCALFGALIYYLRLVLKRTFISIYGHIN